VASQVRPHRSAEPVQRGELRRAGQGAAGIIAAAQAQQEIGAILDQYGVAGPARAVYLSFGMKVWHATQRLTGPALSTEVNGLTQYWQTAYGANPTILNAIAQALGVTALSY